MSGSVPTEPCALCAVSDFVVTPALADESRALTSSVVVVSVALPMRLAGLLRSRAVERDLNAHR